MIFQLEQIKTGFNMAWITDAKGASVATAICPLQRGQVNVNIDYPDGSSQRLYYNPSDTSMGSSLLDRLTFKLYVGDEMVGSIVGKNQKVKGLFQSYPYRNMNFQGNNYYLYEVGFGKKGLYLCIYRDEKLIAIADKELKVVNFQDKYTVYALDQRDIPAIMPLLMHYDMTAHGDVMEIAVRSVKWKSVNTIQKELIAKFDPEFIPRVKRLDGVVDEPQRGK